MPAQIKDPTVTLQPRKSLHPYVYDYFAYITNVDQQEDFFGKGGAVSINQNHAKNKSVWEALERYSGSHINKKLVNTSFSHLTDAALNPKKIVYFDNDYYSDTEFPYVKCDETTLLDWVYGYSFKNKREILVPASTVYLGYNKGIHKSQAFMPNSSNGLALHKDLKSAGLYGALELIERDAAMITWLSKMKIPRIDLTSLKNAELIKLINNVQLDGLHIELMVSTQDFHIPSIICVIYSKVYIRPYASFGLSTGVNIELAALKAIEEALMVRTTLELANFKNELNKIDESHVENYMDHILYYADPANSKKWQFLLEGEKMTISQIAEQYQFFESEDILFDKILDYLTQANNDLIIVDVTDRYVKKMGLFVVRAIIPFLQPFPMNHKYQLTNKNRFVFLFGERNSLLNNDPHPFG